MSESKNKMEFVPDVSLKVYNPAGNKGDLSMRGPLRGGNLV